MALGCALGFVVFAGSDAGAKGIKMDVCHVPPGDPGNAHTITVSENALTAHLAHGDTMGACPNTCPCYDSVDLAIINPPFQVCSLDGNPAFVDDRFFCGTTDIEGAFASVTIGTAPNATGNQCDYISVAENPTGPGCVIREDTQNVEITDAEAYACLALLEGTFTCP